MTCVSTNIHLLQPMIAVLVYKIVSHQPGLHQRMAISQIQNYSLTGNYKVQVYDYSVKDYMPSAPGLGMYVEVRDPNHDIVLSRVSYPVSPWFYVWRPLFLLLYFLYLHNKNATFSFSCWLGVAISMYGNYFLVRVMYCFYSIHTCLFFVSFISFACLALILSNS